MLLDDRRFARHFAHYEFARRQVDLNRIVIRCLRATYENIWHILEFDEARDWIREKLSFEKDVFVNLFETTIRVLGGLLSAFHLSGDELFKAKAADIGGRLAGALTSPTPVPYSDVNLLTRQGKQPGVGDLRSFLVAIAIGVAYLQWGGESSLSEITSIQLVRLQLSFFIIYKRLAFRSFENCRV